MRVIAGEAKGRKLRALADRKVRPSTDRLKEALFSSLGPRVVGAGVLDLYAGSGGLGIEALSRGAREAVFVEADRGAAEVIRLNLVETGLAARARVVESDVEAFLQRERGPWDLVLIDPPYALGLPSGVLELLAAGRLSDAGWVVVEADARREAVVPPGWSLAKRKRYGDSLLLYMEQAGSPG